MAKKKVSKSLTKNQRLALRNELTERDRATKVVKERKN